MYEIWFLIGLYWVAVAVTLHFVTFFYDFYSAGAIQDAFTPEKIQEQMQEAMANQDLSDVRAAAGAQGGVNRSAAVRMKELDSMLGEGMISAIDPTIKAAVSTIFPDFEGWIERNPDLAEKGLKRLQPFLENIMKGAGGGNSGQSKSGGWG